MVNLDEISDERQRQIGAEARRRSPMNREAEKEANRLVRLPATPCKQPISALHSPDTEILRRASGLGETMVRTESASPRSHPGRRPSRCRSREFIGNKPDRFPEQWRRFAAVEKATQEAKS